MASAASLRSIDDRGLAISALSGALVAGLVAGTLSGMVDDALAVPVGVAVAMPIWTVFGFGVQGLDVDRYHAARGRAGLAVDAVVTIGSALVVGLGVVLATEPFVADTAVLVGIGAGATWVGGGVAYAWLTRAFWAQVRQSSERDASP